MVNLVNPSCPWLVLTPKVLQLCINHFMLVLCKPVWVSKACQIFLVPSRSSSTPLYPSKVLQTRECAPTPCPSAIFCLRLTFESFKESRAHQISTIVETSPTSLPMNIVDNYRDHLMNSSKRNFNVHQNLLCNSSCNLGHRWDLLNKLIWECP